MRILVRTLLSLHSHIANLRGRVGINGVYDFRRIPQRGLDENAGEILGWDPAQKNFAAVSKPAGRLR